MCTQQTANARDVSKEEKKLRKAIAQAIRDVTNELNSFSFNTAIAKLMILYNTLSAAANINAATELLKNFDKNEVLDLPTFKNGALAVFIIETRIFSSSVSFQF